MKKLVLLLVVLSGITTLKAQNTITGVETPKNSIGGMFETIFDQYSNKYSLADIKTDTPKKSKLNNTMLSSSLLCSSGMFELYFETGSGMESATDTQQIARRTVACQVFNDLSNFINSPLKNAGNTTKVKIWVRDINQVVSSPNGVLGLATSFYNMPYNTTTGFGGIADNEIWKTIHAGTDSYTNVVTPIISNGVNSGVSGLYYHGMMAFNFSTITNWNTILSANAPVGQYDLYSVILHEVTHSLGFASLINANGTSKFGTGFNYYSRYDRFLKNNDTSKALITNNGSCGMYNYGFNPLLTSAVLQPGSPCTTQQTTCATAIKFIGTSTVPVYTPNCFDPPSSLSHFEDQCIGAPNGNNTNAYFTMTDANGTGVTKRFLKFEERNALGDIGYQLNTTFGNNTTAFGSYNNYGGAITTGINVAGINDGISSGSFIFTINPGVDFNINGILVNDENATSFECLQDIYDNTATINGLPVFSGTSTTNIVFNSSISGLHLLRYVPANGIQRGNITYIYIYVRDITNCSTSSLSCEYVLNGDFEQNIIIPSNASSIYLACGWKQTNLASPDYFFTGANNVGIPCNFTGYQTSNNNIGNGYAGMANWNQNGYQYSESIKSKLQTPLLPDKTYQLSFDTSLAESHSAFVNKLQAYLTINEIPQMASAGDLPITNPDMLFTTQYFLKDSNNWQKVVFQFKTQLGGEQFLYLGGLNLVQIQSNTPSPLNIGNCNYYNGTSPGSSSYQTAYYYIDNVSIIPVEVSLNLINSVCLTQTLSNLNSYITLQMPNGTFTGSGVTLNNGIYSFNAATAGLGIKTITYTYTNNLGCLVNVYSQITVSNCTSTSCPGNLVFNNTQTVTSATYQASNTISTNTNYFVNGGSSITLVAGNSITFSPKSEIKASNSSNFTARLGSCTQTSARTSDEEVVKEQPFIKQEKITLFPNPTKETITISTINSDLKKITIYSIEGKMVFSQNIEKANSYQLNVANYQNGIYMALIETEDGKIFREKIFKN